MEEAAQMVGRSLNLGLGAGTEASNLLLKQEIFFCKNCGSLKKQNLFADAVGNAKSMYMIVAM